MELSVAILLLAILACPVQLLLLSCGTGWALWALIANLRGRKQS